MWGLHEGHACFGVEMSLHADIGATWLLTCTALVHTQGLPVREPDVQLESGAKLVQQMNANVHAAFVCKAYYTSQIWMKVKPFSGPIIPPFCP